MPELPLYRNRSTDLLCKSIDWFLYEGITGTEWVKQLLAFLILYKNNNPSDLQQNIDRYYICLLCKIDSKLFRPKHQILKQPPKNICIINFKSKAIEYINYLKYLTNLTLWCNYQDDFKIKKTDLYVVLN